MMWTAAILAAALGTWWLISSNEPASASVTPTPVESPPFPSPEEVQRAKAIVASNPDAMVNWIVVTHNLSGSPSDVLVYPHPAIGAVVASKALFAALKRIGWTDFGVWTLECQFDQSDIAMILRGDTDPFRMGKCREVWYAVS
jgi:hypothetical protein